MLKLLVYLLVSISAFSIFAAPWLTAVFYSLNGLMQPKYIWPWTFPDFAVSKTLAIIAILAWGVALLRGRIDFSVYHRKQNYLLLILWGLFYLSDHFSPFPEYFAATRAEVVMETLDTIMIMYFVQLGLITNKVDAKKALIAIAATFALIIIYYVYWANNHYFSSNWYMFTRGRLNGPARSTYGDQNVLATLVVTGMPFVLFGYFFLKNFWLKWSCLFIIPLLWHALFLFGSRGSLLGIAAATCIAALMLEKNFQDSQLIKFKYVKLFRVVLVIGLVMAIVYQGGALLSRSAATKNMAQSGSERPLDPRIESWKLATEVIADRPMLGVGPQRFQMAGYTRGKQTYVAHSTFFNFAANCGLPAGLIFLYLCWLNFKNYRYCNRGGIEKSPSLDYLNKACTCSLFGFFVCGLFLDLIVFESFYFLLMLNLAKNHVFEREILKQESQEQDAATEPEPLRSRA